LLQVELKGVRIAVGREGSGLVCEGSRETIQEGRDVRLQTKLLRARGEKACEVLANGKVTSCCAVRCGQVWEEEEGLPTESSCRDSEYCEKSSARRIMATGWERMEGKSRGRVELPSFDGEKDV
jgi:hypothetical protein